MTSTRITKTRKRKHNVLALDAEELDYLAQALHSRLMEDSRATAELTLLNPDHKTEEWEVKRRAKMSHLYRVVYNMRLEQHFILNQARR